MIIKTKVVRLTLKTNANVAREVSHEVLARSNPHASSLIENKLDDLGINEDSLSKYFTMLGDVVAEFWQAQYDLNFKPTLKSHEVRSLYLPLIMSVIFASVGNLKTGNYEYRIEASEANVDREWILEYSAKLESVREYIIGSVNQIGNYQATPQTTVMLAILGEVTDRDANIYIRDGVTADRDLAGISALVGLSLVESAYDILYTGVDQVNFRDLIGTVVQKKPDLTSHVEGGSPTTN